MALCCRLMDRPGQGRLPNGEEIMRCTFASFIIALVALAATTVTATAYTDVTCPLTQARRTITNNLPDGWWTTPMVYSLSETRVITIGGRPALQCVYGASGSIQRYAPDGMTCTAREGGFRCVAAGPSTFSTGSFTVRQTYLFDLDRGRETQEGADLWFQAETRDLLYLVPRNGAQISVGDRSNRGYAGCREARYTRDRVSLSDIPVGSYVCVRTNEGRISQFRLNAVSPGSPKVLTIGYTTWE
jgi:hypothetical protein